MTTITKERLLTIKQWRETYGPGSNVVLPAEEAEELARIALTSLEAEPVAWTWHYREQWHVTNDERRAEFVAKDGDVTVLPLYRHAQPVAAVPGNSITVIVSQADIFNVEEGRTYAGGEMIAVDTLRNYLSEHNINLNAE